MHFIGQKPAIRASSGDLRRRAPAGLPPALVRGLAAHPGCAAPRAAQRRLERCGRARVLAPRRHLGGAIPRTPLYVDIVDGGGSILGLPQFVSSERRRRHLGSFSCSTGLRIANDTES